MFSAQVNFFRLSNNSYALPPPLIIPPQINYNSPIRSPSITPEYRVPSLILPGLYLSGIDCINETILDKYNIKHVISVMNNPPKLSDKYNQFCIPINDDFSAVIRPYFESAHQIINDALNNGENILIHCYAGISRSATIVISYIMKRNSFTDNDAITFVRNKRNIIDPNFVFCYALQNYGKELQPEIKNEYII
jgi:protein-tyrosine phosphatase